ncbi:MAG: hypothetical protein KKB62_03495 [Nanoarchaeota archaeon]|nr:hypothetical protein [Nanoarchaeota archaeon]
MGKNRDRESLIRLITNTVVHEIVRKNSNRPESEHFLSSEVISYRGETEKSSLFHNWNKEDKKYIKEKSLKKIAEKLNIKYSDITYDKKDPKIFLEKELKSLGL